MPLERSLNFSTTRLGFLVIENYRATPNRVLQFDIGYNDFTIVFTNQLFFFYDVLQSLNLLNIIARDWYILLDLLDRFVFL